MQIEKGTGRPAWETPMVEIVPFGVSDVIRTSGAVGPTRSDTGTGDQSSWNDLFGSQG
mgnify:FL=1